MSVRRERSVGLVRRRGRDAHDGAIEAAADLGHEPGRPTGGHDHDLARRKRPQRVLDRLKSVAVADGAARLDARLCELGDRDREALLGLDAGAAEVRRPVREHGVEGRREHEDRGAGAAVAAPRGANRLDGRVALDRLGRDDEHASALSARRSATSISSSKRARAAITRIAAASSAPAAIPAPGPPIAKAATAGTQIAIAINGRDHAGSWSEVSFLIGARPPPA